MSIGHHDAFEARGTSFEEAYFRKKDADLVEKLRTVFQAKRDREELKRVTGITSDEVLDRMMAVNASGEMLTAFKLLPLVEIAWADGACDKREAEAVVRAAIKHGVPADSAALKQIKAWLERGPDPEARKAWAMYAGELRRTLNPAELKTFREDLLATAREIASLSGGILSTFFTVSANEKQIIEMINAALGGKG
ncbi:MAG: hypothetical protein QM783_04280 [Phycisphaerales bacterium]